MRRMTGMAAMLVVSALVWAKPVRAQGVQPVATSDQVKDSLFEGTEKFAAGATNVSDVNMDQKTLGMMAGSQYGDMAKKVDFIVVHSYTYDKPGMYKLGDLDVFRLKLKTADWSCIVHEQTKTTSTDVCMRNGADHESNEMVVIDAEPKELTFVHLKGRMSLADLQKMQGMGGPPTPTPPAPPLKSR